MFPYFAANRSFENLRTSSGTHDTEFHVRLRTPSALLTPPPSPNKGRICSSSEYLGVEEESCKNNQRRALRTCQNRYTSSELPRYFTPDSNDGAGEEEIPLTGSLLTPPASPRKNDDFCRREGYQEVRRRFTQNQHLQTDTRKDNAVLGTVALAVQAPSSSHGLSQAWGRSTPELRFSRCRPPRFLDGHRSSSDDLLQSRPPSIFQDDSEGSVFKTRHEDSHEEHGVAEHSETSAGDDDSVRIEDQATKLDHTLPRSQFLSSLQDFLADDETTPNVQASPAKGAFPFPRQKNPRLTPFALRRFPTALSQPVLLGATSPIRSQKPVQRPDRFIPNRNSRSYSRERYLLSNPPGLLGMAERLARKQDLADDPFSSSRIRQRLPGLPSRSSAVLPSRPAQTPGTPFRIPASGLTLAHDRAASQDAI